MATVYKTTFQLRRGTLAEWESKNPVLAVGEPGYATDVCKLKIGNGTNAWTDLEYIGENQVLSGYYFNESFYTDSTYTIELTKHTGTIYIDLNNYGGYTWTGFAFTPLTPQATADLAGVMKLYQAHGENTDGAMSQKVVTEGVNSIALALDDTNKECLVLDLPWD